jgi:trk system potassium uptake protein TrkH
LKLILHLVGFLSLALGSFMLPSLIISLYDGAPDARGIGLAAVICMLGGAALAGVTRNHQGNLGLRDAFKVVTLCWFLAGALGSLPYLLAAEMVPEIAKYFPTFADCFFESVSGFSTTGSTILTNIEAVPRGLLFWRATTHWLGGMGIVVLSIAILPLLGGGGMNLFKAEAPGGILPDKLAPRIAETARSMWWVYIILTFAEVVMLLVGEMSLYDALAHAFATVATGGFSTKNASVAGFDSAFIDYTISFFMFLAGVNFFLHYQALHGKPKSYFKDSEFKFYAGVIGVVIFLVFSDIAGLEQYSNDLFRAVRDTVFTVISICTTTGFGTADFEQWPEFSKFLLVALMIMGGSAGSTAGGSKCLRVQIIFKAGYRELKRILHPSAIIPVRIGRRAIPDSSVASVLGFITCISALFLFASAVLTALDIDLLTACTAVIACIFNIGPGLGKVGPTDNFFFMPDLAKFILSGCMILGRLEVYTVLVLLIPDFYKK